MCIDILGYVGRQLVVCTVGECPVMCGHTPISSAARAEGKRGGIFRETVAEPSGLCSSSYLVGLQSYRDTSSTCKRGRVGLARDDIHSYMVLLCSVDAYTYMWLTPVHMDTYQPCIVIHTSPA